MERLWAGWRMTYIKGLDGHGARCLFCGLKDQPASARSMILEVGETMYLVLNAYPYNVGHMMVVPKRHIAGPAKLKPAESIEYMALAARAEAALRAVYKPHGFNLGVNLGRTAGAGVLGHMHLHVVPRWNGDTNFMPVIGATKVLPEDLLETYEKLRAALAGEAAPRRVSRRATPPTPLARAATARRRPRARG